MRKIAIRGLALLVVTATAACHRPYALLQRTPAEHFATKHAVLPPTSVSPSSDSSLVDWPVDSLPADGIIPPLLASTTPAPGEPTTTRVQRQLQHMRTLLTEPASQPESDKQPRPRPKTQKKGMTLREFFGLPERKPKTAWQRINWNLKAGFVLILIAVAFALLKITILAIIFGVLAALIILRGLRKTWKPGGFLGL